MIRGSNAATDLYEAPDRLLTIQEASILASELLNRNIDPSNISYLVQYGKIKKYASDGATLIDWGDLKRYYKSYQGTRELHWKDKLGEDLNWGLSFSHLREIDTTKHVHRLHPYKGKFIPQLVEYFIDDHIDSFKKRVFFSRGDIILDPFCGSGTTLVQANELGIHSIGIDISGFNSLITEAKLLDYDLMALELEIRKIIRLVLAFETDHHLTEFENTLADEMKDFNAKYFPSPEFRYRLNKGLVNEEEYGRDKEQDFLPIYERLVRKYSIKLKQERESSFLDKWYVENVRQEIDCTFKLINDVKDIKNKKILSIILSRSIRSCRATTHSDLATLKDPQLTTYYCHKHGKICRPLFSIKEVFSRYASDTVRRLATFSNLKTAAHHVVIQGDSRIVDIMETVRQKDEAFCKLLSRQKIKGIFSSPPYVGQIDYHEQHAYAYDLFGFERKDDCEIGPLYKGQGLQARRSYVEGISRVLENCGRFLSKDADVFLVANDKFNLYPEIAKNAQMRIFNQYKRPVLNRTERDKSPYSEIIFHLKRR